MAIFKTPVLILFFFLLAEVRGFGQVSYTLLASEPDQQIINGLNLDDLFRNQVRNRQTLNAWMYHLYENGYLLANYELHITDPTSTRVDLFLGERFTWLNLKKGNVPEDLLSRMGYKETFFDQKMVNFKRITKFFESIVTYAERNGYPFANIRLKGLEIEDHEVSAEIDFDHGPFITFDSLDLVRQNKVKASFLEAYLKIKPGSPYNQLRVDEISKMIGNLSFLKLASPPDLSFSNSQCQVHLDLEDIKSSSFDGIIGFLPNENEAGKLLVTGQVYLNLENLLRSGKRFKLNWRRVNIQSQELNLAYIHPVIFKAPIDLGFSFDLLKQDTTFITRDAGFQLFYNNDQKGKIGFQYDLKISRLIGTGSSDSLERIDYADYTLNYYGVVYRYLSLDHPVFPSRGWDLIVTTDLGLKNILSNENIPDNDPVNAQGKVFQWRSSLNISKYFTLIPRNVILMKIQGGYQNADRMFKNDLYRLGGLKTIRGFNELFFFANQYLISTIEYRYMFENESQILLFFDGSVLNQKYAEVSRTDFPVGLGGGITLSTKAGLLNVIYGLGKAKDQPFNIKNSKIHIGYTGRF